LAPRTRASSSYRRWPGPDRLARRTQESSPSSPSATRPITRGEDALRYVIGAMRAGAAGEPAAK